MDEQSFCEPLSSPAHVFNHAKGRDDSIDRIDLADVWRELKQGKSSVVLSAYSADKSYVALRYHAGCTRSASSERSLDFLERVIAGECQKVIAMNNDIAVSTVAQRVADAQRAMGLGTRVARVPILVTMAVHAYRGNTQWTRGTVVRSGREGRGIRIICCERPDHRLDAMLTRSECEVLRLFLEGKSYAEVALLRGAAVRTIANQLSASWRTLGVSGRAEVLRLLLEMPRVPEPKHTALDTTLDRVLAPVPCRTVATTIPSPTCRPTCTTPRQPLTAAAVRSGFRQHARRTP